MSLLLALAPAAHADVPREIEANFASYTYAGPDQKQKELDTAGIVAAILADPSGTHLVWAPGWASWKSWSEVPELVSAVEAAKAGPPAVTPPPATELISYSNGGAAEQLTAGEIAARVGSEPSGYHMVWKPGMAEWVPAGELPEVKSAMGPPPAPTKTAKSEKPAKAAPPKAAKTPKGAAPAGPDLPSDEEKEKPINLLKSFQGGAELQASVPWMYRFVNAAGEVVESDPVGTSVHRARLWLGHDFGEHASARVALNAATVNDSAADAAGLTGVADGWQFTIPYGYLDLHTGKSVVVGARVGAQDVAIGALDYVDGYENYYFGGRNSSYGLEATFDVAPRYDLGATLYVGSAQPLWKAEVQYMNGSGVAAADDNFGRLVVGRGTFMSPGLAGDLLHLNVWASGYWEQKEIDNSVVSMGGSFAAEARVKDYARVMGGLLVGGTGSSAGGTAVGYNHLGYHLGVAGALPLRTAALDRLELVYVNQSYNARVGDTENPGGAYVHDVGLNLWFAGEGRGALMAGLAYEGWFPIALAEDVLHQGVLQVAARY